MIIFSQFETLPGTLECVIGRVSVKHFLSIYNTTTAIRNEVMKFKDRRQVPPETKIEFSLWENTIAYRCSNAFSLKDKISTFLLWLQSAIQTIVAHETEELDDRRRTFKNLIQIARKEGEACRAHLTKAVKTHDDIYVRSLRKDFKALEMYGKRGHHAFQGSSKIVIPVPRIPGLVIEYHQDLHRWFDQPLQRERQTISCNVECHECHAHGRYSPDCRLPYESWKNVISNFEILTSTRQKHGPCNSIQIELFAIQTA